MKGFRFQLSRTFLLIIGGVTVLGGGSGVAAVVIGADKLLGPSYANVNGLECTTVETVRIKKADRYWIRKYVTVDEPGDGPARLKTALRVARKVQQAEHSDLVQVTVLDNAGPTDRARMRGRAIGAQVVYIPDLDEVPEGTATQPITAYYVEGAASATGEFWGMRIDLPKEDVEALSAALTDDAGCADPAPEGQEAHGSKGHGAETGHDKAADHGNAADDSEGGHGTDPAADGHGAPAAGHGDETPVAEHRSTEEPGLLASLMGMVGLGGEPAVEGQDGSSAAGHDLPPDDLAKPGHAVATEQHPGTGQPADAGPHSMPAEEASAEKGWFDSIKGMVGLDEGTEAPEEKAALPGHGKGAAETPVEPGPVQAAGQDHAEPATSKPDGHGAAWLAKMRAQPLTPEAGTMPAAEEGAHAAPAANPSVPEEHAAENAVHGTAEQPGPGAQTAHAEVPQAAVVAENDDPEKHRRKPAAPVVTH